MSICDIDNEYMLILEDLHKKMKVTQDLYYFLQKKLIQKHHMTLSLFETLSWSQNEKAVLSKLNALYQQEASICIISTESSLPFQKRPSTIIVPKNRELDFYLMPYSNTSIELNDESNSIVKGVNLPKMNCFQELKFNSDENNEAKRFNENDIDSFDDIVESPEKENYLEDRWKKIRNIQKNKENKEFNIEKKLSMDEILEKYDHGIMDEENNGDEIIGDETSPIEKVIGRVS